MLFASAALSFLLWQRRPLGGSVWSVEHPAARSILWLLFAVGWLQVLVTTLLINQFDLFSLRQVWLYFRGRPYTKVHLPLYLGFLIAFWSTPNMTLAHLCFAVMTTAYIVVAIQFEGRDLLHEHGVPYEEHRRSVPMLLPMGMPRDERSAGRGVKRGLKGVKRSFVRRAHHRNAQACGNRAS